MKQSRSRAPLFLFLGTECALYGSFLYCDLTSRGAAGTALKYAALLLCLLFSLARARTADGKPLEPGVRVRVLRIEGAKVIVEPCHTPEQPGS